MEMHECVDEACNLVDITFGDMGGQFGTCPPDGFVNIHDRNLVLACFAGTTSCDPLNIDAGGPFGSCVPDGFCNVHDANLALAIFSGTSSCTCPGSPAPQTPAVTVAQSGVTLVPSTRRVRPGGIIEVRLFLDHGVDALQSYQLHIESGGGVAGTLELIDIEIESRKDHVFARLDGTFEAANTATGQVIGGLSSGSVATLDDGYLATFVFRASKNAAGMMWVDLRIDEASGDQTFLISDFENRVATTETTPAVIEVGRTRR
jgi:hypothetical protein